MPAEKEPDSQKPKSPAIRSALEQNREFYDQFFTKIVKAHFKTASEESKIRHMNILPGSCTAARCQLTANNHHLVLMAAGMASTSPEIRTTYSPPKGSNRKSINNILRYQPPIGWIADPDGSPKPIADLSVWTDLTISAFLDWTSGLLI